MANRACLELGGLIVERGSSGRRTERRIGVALHAQDVDVGEFQKMDVGGAVRRMAGHAAFGLDRGVLEDEGTALIDVAGEADGVLGGGGAKLRLAESAMGIVAIGALHEAFVDAVMHGHIELSLVFEMAAIAELGLFFGEKEFRVLGVMNGMAVEAVHIIVSVLGALKIHLLLAGGVTFHALRDDGF